jgi:hypothetical protein
MKLDRPLKKGDKVTVEFIVSRDQNEYAEEKYCYGKMDNMPGAGELCLPVSFIKDVTPAPLQLKTGMVLTSIKSSATFKIIAVSGDQCWYKHKYGECTSWTDHVGNRTNFESHPEDFLVM